MWAKLGVAVAAIGLLSGLGSGVWFHGRDAGRAEVYADWAEQNQIVAAEVAKRDRANRALEEQHRRTVEDITSAYRKAEKAREDEVGGVLADIRGDNLRLRQRLRGCAAAGGADPDSAAGPTADGASPAGLSRQDEEFLVRLSAEADDLALRLAHLQDYVRGLPTHCGG